MNGYAPGSLLSAVDHRHVMDVADQLQQVRIGIDQDRLVALAEEVTGLGCALMDAARVAAGDSLHEATDGNAVDLQREVNRVRRPAVRVQARAGATQRRREQTFEELVVLVLGEDRASRAAPLDYVVRSSRNV